MFKSSNLTDSPDDLAVKSEVLSEHRGVEELLDVMLVEVARFRQEYLLGDFHVNATRLFNTFREFLEDCSLGCGLHKRVVKKLIYISAS
jgi:hypothetical protein